MTAAEQQWYRAARSAGLDYRLVSMDSRIAALAQLGPAVVHGLQMTVAGEHGHDRVGGEGTMFATTTYRHPPASNDP